MSADTSETPDNRPTDKGIDTDRLRESMSRLMDIYAGISDTAATAGSSRCPYKDAQARCTARFPCQNQFYKVAGEKAICTGSDDLDYRSAWES
ncbi:MAG: hypothetical protein O3C10_02065 [Chloroflexi bacterium]|nr:hypothetical protein [Chloroflexota bacterium]